MTNNLMSIGTPWLPPESKKVQLGIKVAFIGALIFGGFKLFTMVAPTIVDATDLLAQILENTLYLSVLAVSIAAFIWTVFSAISPKGVVNNLLRLPYYYLVRQFTQFFIKLDPMAPIDRRIEFMENKKSEADKHLQNLSGVKSSFIEQANECRAKAKKALDLGAVAIERGSDKARKQYGHDHGVFTKMTERFEGMAAKLDPLYSLLAQVSDACDLNIRQLKTDRYELEQTLRASKAMTGAISAFNKFFGKEKNDKTWEYAEQAEQMIKQNYGESIGYIEDVSRYTQPLLESISIEDASYDMDLLRAVQESGKHFITSSNATRLPEQPAYQALPDTSSAKSTSSLHNFLK